MSQLTSGLGDEKSLQSVFSTTSVREEELLLAEDYEIPFLRFREQTHCVQSILMLGMNDTNRQGL